MATALLPFDEWVAGTLQNSVPANNNALRSEVLSANVISDSTTAQPGSPADGDCYIVPAGATGTQWATFTADSLAYFRGGTWYEFTAYEGLLKVVAGVVKLYNGSSWEAAGGGGIDGITIEENGTPVATDVTTVNFAGSNVSATQTSPGVVEVEFTGGGGGGGGGGGATFPDPGVQPWGYITANVAGSGFVNIGGLAIVATGTGAARTVSGGSLIESLPRSAVTATAATNAVCGHRANSATIFCLGSNSDIGGFNVKHRVAVGNGAPTASHRFFSGMISSTAAPTDVEPSSLLNIIGIGYDSADTQVQIMHNDGSGTATKVALGASFPKPTVALANVYDIELDAVPGSGAVTYKVVDVDTGATATGTLSTNLPSATTMLTFLEYLSAGGTSTAVSIESCFWYYRLGKARP